MSGGYGGDPAGCRDGLPVAIAPGHYDYATTAAGLWPTLGRLNAL